MHHVLHQLRYDSKIANDCCQTRQLLLGGSNNGTDFHCKIMSLLVNKRHKFGVQGDLNFQRIVKVNV